MKSELKNGWQSVAPPRTPTKSTARLGVFTEVASPRYIPRDAPVYLNVYDLTTMNSYLYWAGVGIFHSGVEVHGVEYAFGALEYPASGIFEIKPRRCPGFKFRKSIFVGMTSFNPDQVKEFMKQQATNYYGDTYHIIIKNCNHFCEDVCYKLTGNQIPKWVNRLARIGSVCNCIFPEALKTTIICQDDVDQDSDYGRNILQSSQSSFSSISTNENEEEAYLFLRAGRKSQYLLRN